MRPLPSPPALKIQYLRLIHNFCDRDGPNRSNKQLLAAPRSTLLPPTAITSPRAGGSGAGSSNHRLHGHQEQQSQPQHSASSSSGSGSGSGSGGGVGTRLQDGDSGQGAGSRLGERASAVLQGEEGGGGGSNRSQGGGLGEGEEEKDGASDRGLMWGIIQVLKKESADSVYRFWLASCVEAFLRGSDPRDQVGAR